MTVLRVLFAAVWLLFGVTVSAHAMPVAQTPCHGDSHHEKSPKPVAATMACCGQPAPVDLPAPGLSLRLGFETVAFVPAKADLPAGITPSADPRPPKAV